MAERGAGMATPPLGTLWLGDTLPKLELMCLLSMVARRWDITVFSYGPIDNLPGEIPLRDARDIHPANLSDPALGEAAIHPAMFSDIFRLHMMEKEGLVWVDSDFLVVKEDFPPVTPILVGMLPGDVINNAALWIEPGHPVFEDYKAAVDEDPPQPKPYFRDVRNQAIRDRAGTDNPVDRNVFSPKHLTGPTPLTYFLNQHSCMDQVLPHTVFYPLSYNRRKELWRSNTHVLKQFADDTVAVHMWGSHIRNWMEVTTPDPGTFLAEQIKLLDKDLMRVREGAA
ncbi:MAG: hypothetical protein AAGF60_11280 [Pseudomonadota bacterium]